MPRQLNLFQKNEQTSVKFDLEPLHLDCVALDTEATGLSKNDKILGFSYSTDIQSGYIPVNHKYGFNFDRDLVRRWAKDNLAGKDIYMAEAKFDIRKLRDFGIDLELLKCRVHDIQFHAALLDSNRKSYKVEDLAQEILGEGKLPFNMDHVAHSSSEEIAEYAQRDAELTFRIAERLEEQLERYELCEVEKLESSIIFPVIEMEDNGSLIDCDKLMVWDKVTQSRYVRAVLKLSELVGQRIEPTRAKDMQKLYKILGFKIAQTESGNASFTKEQLKKHEHEAIQLALAAKELASLRSKFITKYNKAISNSHIYYKLNQLKADDYGTVTGRFSSSGGKDGGINIQQVFNTENLDEILRDFPIRELFIPDPGYLWCTADAKQIEFRLFAHYAQSDRLTETYQQNPDVDFHSIVADLVGIDRNPCKRINFGKLYGMGVAKLADNLGCSQEKAEYLSREYDKMFPEAKKLLHQAAEKAEARGWVKTLTGRRRWYPKGSKYHSALNAVIQGTAADVMKYKIKQVYENKSYIGYHKLRFTVHDEIDLDIPNKKSAERLKEVLEEPCFGIRIPLLWDVGFGENWGKAK